MVPMQILQHHKSQLHKDKPLNKFIKRWAEMKLNWMQSIGSCLIKFDIWIWQVMDNITQLQTFPEQLDPNILWHTFLFHRFLSLIEDRAPPVFERKNRGETEKKLNDLKYTMRRSAESFQLSYSSLIRHVRKFRLEPFFLGICKERRNWGLDDECRVMFYHALELVKEAGYNEKKVDFEPNMLSHLRETEHWKLQWENHVNMYVKITPSPPLSFQVDISLGLQKNISNFFFLQS